jgi:hypothetical protein
MIKIIKMCTFEGCESKVIAKGLCNKHYRQQPDRKAVKKKWSDDNAERQSAINKERMKIDPIFRENSNERSRVRYHANKEEDSLRKKKQPYKDKMNANRRRKYAESSEYRNRVKSNNNKSVAKHKVKVRERQSEYWSKRRKEDPQVRIRGYLRKRVTEAIKSCGGKKELSVSKELGCTWKFFGSYIESLWLPGMSWDNYGVHGWHIDHIFPLSLLDLTNPEDFKKACHYTNLQPLWALDNLRKSNKAPK